MTLQNKDRLSLIKYRLIQAEETVSDVELLIANNRYRSAVNRIYYGMFYALLALAVAEGFETSKHIQLIGWFNKNFVRKGSIDMRYGKMINKAFNRRTKGDYDTYIDFPNEVLTEMFKDMQLFIAEIQRVLNRHSER